MLAAAESRGCGLLKLCDIVRQAANRGIVRTGNLLAVVLSRKGDQSSARKDAMTDHVDAKTRSRIMSKIEATGNVSTEWALRARLVAEGVSGFTLHADVSGTPDLAFIEEKIAIFTDGCFWHGCPQHYSEPETNQAFWKRKIAANRKRDLRVTQILREAGWEVIRIWEHELVEAPHDAVSRVKKAISKCRRYSNV